MMTLIKLAEYKNHLIESFVQNCKDELVNLSSMATNSILRKTDAKSIKDLKTNDVLEEFYREIPSLTRAIKSITNNNYITTQVCNTIASSHNQLLSALRYKNGLFFRQCGLLRKVRQV